MSKLSNILIGIIVMSTVLVGLGLFIEGGVSTYDIEHDSEFLDGIISYSDQVHNLSREVKDQLLTVEGNPSAFDILSSFFTGAYNTVKTVGSSFNILFSINNDVFGELNLGTYSSFIKNAFISIILIIIFVGIILNIITKSDRT